MRLIVSYKYFVKIIPHIEDENKHSMCGRNFNGNFDYSYVTLGGDYDGTIKEFTAEDVLALDNLCKNCRRKFLNINNYENHKRNADKSFHNQTERGRK